MKRMWIIALLALSFGLTVGCADGKSNRRARIAAGQLKTGPAKVADTADTTDTTPKDTAPKQTLPDDKNPPADLPADQKTYDSAKAEAIQSEIQSLVSVGENEAMNADDLKGMILDLEEVIVSYTSLEDVDSQKFIAATTLKYDASTGVFQQEEAVSTGNSKDLIVIGLPTLNHVEFAADGSTPAQLKTRVTQIIPLVKNQQLTLAGQDDQASGTSVLEETFQNLLQLEPDADGKIQSVETGATINFVRLKKLDGAIHINVEVQATAHQVQTFILKFKVTK